MVKPSMGDRAHYVHKGLVMTGRGHSSATPTRRLQRIDDNPCAAWMFLTIVDALSIRGKREWSGLPDSVRGYRSCVGILVPIACALNRRSGSRCRCHSRPRYQTRPILDWSSLIPGESALACRRRYQSSRSLLRSGLPGDSRAGMCPACRKAPAQSLVRLVGRSTVAGVKSSALNFQKRESLFKLCCREARS